MKSFQASRQTIGFTLVELLVVIGILISLAALLLPALASGKASAKGARCMNNLRQIGWAMTLYCSDAQQYPPDLVRLRAALFRSITERQIFWCPALDRSRQELKQDFISYDASAGGQVTGQSLPPGQVLMEDYGYNQYGSGAPGLLLGLRCDPDYGLPERNVAVPADMIAAADVYFQYLFWDSSDQVNPGGIPPWHPYRHKQGSNQLFLDGHVEHARRTQLQKASDSVRRRWNNDNQPHPETWPAP